MTSTYFDYRNSDEYNALKEKLKIYINEKTCFVCIGTDRAIGDCFGPLVGTMLQKYLLPLNVYGTVDNPIHAVNLEERLAVINEFEDSSNIIAIDAAISDSDTNIDKIAIKSNGIFPGCGVGKTLPHVGKIAAVYVEPESAVDFSSSYRLGYVYGAADVLSCAIYEVCKDIFSESKDDTKKGSVLWKMPISVLHAMHIT